MRVLRLHTHLFYDITCSRTQNNDIVEVLVNFQCSFARFCFIYYVRGDKRQ